MKVNRKPSESPEAQRAKHAVKSSHAAERCESQGGRCSQWDWEVSPVKCARTRQTKTREAAAALRSGVTATAQKMVHRRNKLAHQPKRLTVKSTRQ